MKTIFPYEVRTFCISASSLFPVSPPLSFLPFSLPPPRSPRAARRPAFVSPRVSFLSLSFDLPVASRRYAFLSVLQVSPARRLQNARPPLASATLVSPAAARSRHLPLTHPTAATTLPLSTRLTRICWRCPSSCRYDYFSRSIRSSSPIAVLSFLPSVTLTGEHWLAHSI